MVITEIIYIFVLHGHKYISPTENSLIKLTGILIHSWVPCDVRPLAKHFENCLYFSDSDVIITQTGDRKLFPVVHGAFHKAYSHTFMELSLSEKPSIVLLLKNFPLFYGT
jgi:hypothetical protein